MINSAKKLKERVSNGVMEARRTMREKEKKAYTTPKEIFVKMKWI